MNAVFIRCPRCLGLGHTALNSNESVLTCCRTCDGEGIIEGPDTLPVCESCKGAGGWSVGDCEDGVWQNCARCEK